LWKLGQHDGAARLNEDTLARRRRVLGEDHPDTLVSASNLAALLRAAGQTEAARDLDEDTLARRRRVLGEGHPDTQRSADRLAATDDDDEDWDEEEEEFNTTRGEIRTRPYSGRSSRAATVPADHQNHQVAVGHAP
jgi:hypothetical protein